MADTNFTTGTVVTSEWLNDVNDTVYGLPSTAVGKGAGLVSLENGDTVQEFYDKTQERNTVSVTDAPFNAVCDWDGTTGTDDTVAVQAAVDYCIANNLDLVVPRMTRITTVNIDRPVDGAAFDHFFTISGVGGGGFARTTAGAMFSSRIAYNGVNAVSQLIRFSHLKFETPDSANAVFAMDGARYLRSRWDDCSFRKVRWFETTTGEAQSLYMSRCQARRWQDWFMNSSLVNFDVQIDNCLLEAGGRGFRLALPVGSAITQSNIEGMFYHAIEYSGGYGFGIRNCYFEYNGSGAGQDGASVVQTGGESLGMVLDGNYFSAAHTTGPQVVWLSARGARSANNHCAAGGIAGRGVLHSFTANSKVDIDGDIAEGGTLIDGNPAHMSGLTHVQHIGAFLRADGNSLYGANVKAKFYSGRGGVLELRAVNNNTEAATGLDVLETGAVRAHAARISLLSSDVPENNGDLLFQASSNTQLTFKYKGSDGVVRTASLTLV